MKVFVTGGTGFVGSHIVVSLLRNGHEARLLARRPDQVSATFAPHGLEPGEPGDVVVGDATDAAVVAEALQGCDAAVHAAAVFSLRRQDAAVMAGTNEAATRTVLAAAVDAGLDPIIHVSSTVALARREGSDAELPLGDLTDPYSVSKIDSERVAREYQDAGAPVVSVYPGGVLGPDDPYFGEQAHRLSWVARGLFPIWPRGGGHYVDVRDVAETVLACLEPGRGPRRYVVPGAHVTGQELYATVSSTVGRPRPHVDLPGPIAAGLARAMTPLNALTPSAWHYPADADGIGYLARNTRFDDSPARVELGIDPRPFSVSVRDTISWMTQSGHLPARFGPR